MPIPKWCDRKSIRTVKRGGASILVCCPKGKVRAGRCTVGTRAIEVRSAKLSKGTRIEHREHPEFPVKVARQIARDHLARNPKAYGALYRNPARLLKTPITTPAGQSVRYLWALVSEHDGKWYVQATRPTHKMAMEAQRQNPRWMVIDTRKFPHRLY